jgi:formylmethanofuran dehydrogenase subunit C
MIRLTLTARPPFRLSLDGITPDRVAGLDTAALARRPLAAGNRSGVLGDWFRVEAGGEAPDRLVIAGGDERLDDIGAGMAGGELIVEGDVGADAGAAMTGGMVRIAGSAGHGAARAMRGGELHIAGDAGDQLGGALPGEGAGMSEGIVIVAGSAGSGVGDRMRRGLIVVAGAAGTFCAARMLAGTIVVGGAIGAQPGLAMRRGSLLALAAAPPPSPGFADCGIADLTVLRLIGRFLAGRGLAALAGRIGPLRRRVGDLARGGKGEILTLA